MARRNVLEFLVGVKDEASAKLGAIGKSVVSLQASFYALAGATGIAAATKAVAEAGLAMSRLERGLKFVTGSTEEAAREMAFLRQNASRLGLDLQSTAQAYTKLAAAAKGTTLAGNEAREIFVGISEAARVMGLTSEQTSGALTAIEQIISKGKVSAEELRGQLGERLPGAFIIAARAIGVTTAELDKMLVNGELMAEDLLPALADELHNLFAADVADAADSAEAAFARLSNAVFELKAAIAESGLLDALAETAKFMTWIAEGFPKGFGAGDELEEEIDALIARAATLERQLKRSSARGGAAQKQAMRDELELIRAQIAAKKADQQDIMSGGQNQLTTFTPQFLGRTGESRKFFEEAIKGAEAFQKEIAKTAEQFRNEFATAEQQVAMKLDQFDMVDHLFPPDEQVRIRQAIKDALTIEEIDPSEFAPAKRTVDLWETALGQMSEFAVQGARNIQSAFADELFEGFDDGLKGMLASFVKILRRMVAEAAAAKIIENLFGGTKVGMFFGIPGKAGGGPASGMTMVNERGPELINLPNGSTVIPSGLSKSMMGSGAPSFVTNIDARGADPALISRLPKYMDERDRRLMVLMQRYLETGVSPI